MLKKCRAIDPVKEKNAGIISWLFGWGDKPKNRECSTCVYQKAADENRLYIFVGDPKLTVSQERIEELILAEQERTFDIIEKNKKRFDSNAGEVACENYIGGFTCKLEGALCYGKKKNCSYKKPKDGGEK